MMFDTKSECNVYGYGARAVDCSAHKLLSPRGTVLEHSSTDSSPSPSTGAGFDETTLSSSRDYKY